MLKNKIEQFATQRCLKNSLSDVFPLTVESGKTKAFENRHGDYIRDNKIIKVLAE